MKLFYVLPIFFILISCSSSTSSQPFNVKDNSTYLNKPQEITYTYLDSNMWTFEFTKKNEETIYNYFKDISFVECEENLTNMNTFIGWLNFNYDTSIEHGVVDPTSSTFVQISFDKSGFPYFWKNENNNSTLVKSNDEFDMNSCLKFIIENGTRVKN